MDTATRNYPLEDIDRETLFHPNTSIADHLKKGPHIMAEANGVRIKDHQGRESDRLQRRPLVRQHRLWPPRDG